MVTKIKPRRMNTSGPGSLGKDLAYQTEVVFDWAEGGSGVGDMRYSDFNFQDLTDSTVVLDLRTEVTPTGDFVVTPPTTVKDGQTYILRVTNGATAYTMALTGGITNPHGASLTLTPNSTDQFEFLAVGTTLELQPEDAGGAVWGLITGTLSDQTDLQNALNLKANDNAVVHNTGNETVAGTKTFSTSPVVPSKTTDATNTGTEIATEAQVYKKQDKLTQGTGISISSNTVSNTGVLSVNSNTGAINLKTINSTSIIGTGDIVTPTTTVEDNLTSTSTTNALSANQGRILDGKISDLMALGKFLSLWDATTGQPISFPYTTPYAYSTGDYFLVETISSATPPVNYRPNGSSYTGTASSTAETDELEQGDVYIYDGSVWLLQSNHGKTVSFANIAGQPTDNTNLATALGQKQDNLTAGTGISISSNVISNTLEPGRTKIFTLTGSSTTTELQEIMDRVDADKEAIIKYNDGQVRYYYFKNKSSSAYYFEEPTTVDVTTGGGSTSGVVAKQAVINLDGNGDPTGRTPTTITSNFLDTTIDYTVPYTPQYDGSPATKKYVDDAVSGASGIQNDTTGTTTTVSAIWVGTEAEYNALQSHSTDIIYHIY